jgi:hypothetical protein
LYTVAHLFPSLDAFSLYYAIHELVCQGDDLLNLSANQDSNPNEPKPTFTFEALIFD